MEEYYKKGFQQDDKKQSQKFNNITQHPVYMEEQYDFLFLKANTSCIAVS